MLEAINEKNNVKLIVEDAGVELGYYVYVFDLYSQVSKADHLCDNLQQVYNIAKEDYGVLPADFIHIAN